METFKKLMAWQEAMNLAEMVYLATKGFPKEEIYGLTNQVRRAAVSIPSNIAEGNGRTSKEYIHFLLIANGSLKEVETQILISERVGYLNKETQEKLTKQINSVGRLLTALRKSLEK
ncbi:MAG: four helix bundle protein, partial [Fibromonadales bacterium]|nr:four helix bundle protein [Fibromonadales bacterium]